MNMPEKDRIILQKRIKVEEMKIRKVYLEKMYKITLELSNNKIDFFDKVNILQRRIELERVYVTCCEHKKLQDLPEHMKKMEVYNKV